MLCVRRPEGRGRGERWWVPDGGKERRKGKRKVKGGGKKGERKEKGKGRKGEKKERGKEGKGREEFCCYMPLVFTLFQLCLFDVLILLMKIVRAEVY